MSASYEIIDHTADIGLHVFGNDPADLFRNAARALTDVITDRRNVVAVNSIGVSVEGHDWPDLMVNWLRELLYLWSGKDLLIASVEVDRINNQRIVAVAGRRSLLGKVAGRFALLILVGLVLLFVLP